MPGKNEWAGANAHQQKPDQHFSLQNHCPLRFWMFPSLHPFLPQVRLHKCSITTIFTFSTGHTIIFLYPPPPPPPNSNFRTVPSFEFIAEKQLVKMRDPPPPPPSTSTTCTKLTHGIVADTRTLGKPRFYSKALVTESSRLSPCLKYRQDSSFSWCGIFLFCFLFLLLFFTQRSDLDGV